MKNKKKGFILIATTLMVVVSSLAFFTDNFVDKANMKFGNLGVETILRQNDVLDNVAPGDSYDLDFEITNSGSMDNDTRVKFMISVPDDQVGDYELGDIQLSVDGVKLTDLINVEFEYNVGVVPKSETKEFKLSVDIDNKVLNKLQGYGFKLSTLTEVRQVGSSDWALQETDSIKFGNSSDFKVVPNHNVLRSNSASIKRTVIEDVSGYVSTTLHTLEALTVSEFKNVFTNTDDTINIYSENNTKLEQDDKVSSGSIVKLEINDSVYDSLMVITKGDIDGDDWISGNDMILLRSYVSGSKTPTDKQFLASDIDDDGRLTHNDTMMVRAYMMRVSDEFPDFYPQAPRIPQKIDLSISFGDNVDVGPDSTEEEYSYLGNAIPTGTKLEQGDLFRVSVNVSNLRNLDVTSLMTKLNVDNNLVEFVESDELFFDQSDAILAAFPIPENSILPYFTQRPGSAPQTKWMGYNVFSASDDGSSVPVNGYSENDPSQDLSRFILSKEGEYVNFIMRVKEDAPSGSKINFSLSDGDFSFASYGGLYFNATIDKSVSNHLYVK